MRAFLAAMVTIVVIAFGANWALESGPLSDLVGAPGASVRLGQ